MELKQEYYLVLESLSTGVKTVGEIAGELDMEPQEVEAALSALLAFGWVERREKGFFVRREAYGITEAGWSALAKWREEVRDRIERATQLRREGRESEAQQLLAPLEPVLPVLLAMGLIDMYTWGEAVGEEWGEEWGEG